MYSEEERKGALAQIKHVVWAMQRRSGTARPHGRVALRLRQVFSTVAREAVETGKPDRRLFAERILDALGGASCHIWVRAGFMADGRWELLR